MSALALTGAVVRALPERWFGRMALPLVALAAGAPPGGAFMVDVRWSGAYARRKPPQPSSATCPW